MAKKSFEIQGSKLRVGGLDLEAGTTSIVIPGVTQAATYFVEEVDDQDGNSPDIFGSDDNAVTVIDNAEYLYRSNGATASNIYSATFYNVVDGLADGEIEEVNVEGQGVFASADKTLAEASNMWATTVVDPLVSFNAGDWTQIPFRPKLRAGEVENVGGGSGGVVERGVEFPQGEEGDTAGVLASDNSTLYYSTADWVDVNDINKTFAVENTVASEANQSGFQYNFIDFLAADYPDLQTILTTLSNTNNGIVGSDFTVDGGELFGGAQTVYQILSDGTTITVGWTHRVGVDPTTIAIGDDFTVIYTGTIEQPAIWTRILSSDITTSVTEYATGLTVADKDFEIRTTRSDPGQDADVDIYAADDVFIEAGGDQVVISAANEVVINSNYENDTYEWIFNADGHVQFPDGSIQVTAYVAGTSDNNIWVETFTSDAQTTDFVQAASSVEYDADGNIFALFNHSIPTPNSETYTSVAKLSPAGTVLWQVRFSVNLNTDGWGLAYDGVDTVYIAGSTDGTPLTYEFATLTKIDAVDGTIVWSKTYDFEADSSSAVVDVDSDLNPIMVGYAYNGTDNYIVTTKVDSADGTVIWCKTIDGQGYDEAYGMAVGPTGEVVTIGYVDSYGPTDGAETLYTDPVSNVNWTTGANISGGGLTCDVTFTDGVPTFTNIVDTVGNRTVDGTVATISGVSFGGTSPVDDMILKVATVAANDNDDRMVVVKYATDGTIAWQKAVQFDAGYNCSGADADIDADGNIYVCGQYQYDYNSYTTSAMSLVKFNSSGVKQWSRRVVGNCDTFATSVVVGPDNYLYLSGVTGNDTTDEYTWVVAKYNTFGVVEWQRLIDNTTSWSFGGTFWFGSAGGGSNIAVGNGYVALAGAFGDPGIQPKATVVQIDTDATEFSVGDWDIKAATFSGVLNDSASDITVTDAGKTEGTAVPTAADFVTNSDSSNFLSATRAGAASGDSINNGAYSVSVGSNGVVTMVTSRGSLEFGALPEIGGPTHFHIMKAAGDSADLFLGDDYNYVLQRGPASNGEPGYGVEIGANDNDGGDQNVWRFGTDGGLTFPDGNLTIGNSGGGNVIMAATDTSVGVVGQGIGGYVALQWISDITSTSTTTVAAVILNSPFSATSGTVQIATGLVSGPTAENIWEFGADGKLTLPGALVKSTVAKTGVVLPTTTGTVTNLSFSPLGSGLGADYSFYTFTLGATSFSVQVVGGSIDGVLQLQTQPILTVGDIIGTIDSGDLGGTTGTTITVSVYSVTQETPTVLDLTKSVNKLTDGAYTLANGVEGQIMYIVRQNGSTAANIFVEVASARWDGTVYSDQPVVPFQIPFTDMVTIIFTDDAWQQMGGSWA